MCDYPFFIPQVVLFANSSLFWFKVTNEHREFRNYLELFLITGSIIIFLFQKSNKLSKNFIFRSIVTIFFLKINNNTSSLETFEDQNDYLLG